MTNLLYSKALTLKDLKTMINNELIHTYLYAPFEVVLKTSTGYKAFSIELRDFFNRPDCLISNFGANVYFRPLKATNKNFTGYKTIGQLSNAIKKSCHRVGLEFVAFIKKED